MTTSLSVLLDENIDRQVLDYVETEGHSGELVISALEPGADDEGDIAPYARDRDLIVVTKDTDFLRLNPDSHAGVFFLVNHRATAYEIASAIFTIADAFDDRDDLRGVVYLDEWM